MGLFSFDSAKALSSIQLRGAFYELYDASGKKFKTVAASSLGAIVGYSSSFFICQKGAFYELYDAEGKKYKTIAVSSIGEIVTVAGDTFVARRGAFLDTYDKSGRKINTRSAR